MKIMKRTTNTVRSIAYAAMTAALYVIFTYLSAMLGLSSGVIQCRLSEALCILPYFMGWAAVPGLAIGCLLANLLTGAVIYDVLFGTLATLLGALGTYLLRNLPLHRIRLLLPLPTVLSNTAIVPLVLQYAYNVPDAWWFLALTVAIGELIAAGVLGTGLSYVLEKYQRVLFRK